MTPELGSRRGERAGPTLLLIGGIHGNEPAGVEACRRLLARLDASTIAGEVVALQGNPAALSAGRRYLARDLNRQWTPALVAAARAAVARDPADRETASLAPDPETASLAPDRETASLAPDPETASLAPDPETASLAPNPETASLAADPETASLAALADILDRVLERARGPVFALDLHTTSAAGIPFAIAGGAAADRSFAREIPLPVVVGLQESLGGTLTEYLAAHGCVPLAVEGGQHDSPASIAHHEAAIAVGLAAAGIAHPPGLASARDLLARARGDLPPRIEVTLRHPVGPGFRMLPGFANIQCASAGTLLAHDDGGEILAPFDGVLLMPLYQAQGTDGFFYGRGVPG